MVFSKFILFLTISIIVVVFNVKNINAEILSGYWKYIYYRVMPVLQSSTISTPSVWCDNNAMFFDKDGRYALRNVYFDTKSGRIIIQRPSDYCSPNRLPDPTPEQLAQLSALGLDIPSPTDTDEDNTQVGMITPTDSNTFLSMNYDLNLTSEENEMNLREE